MKKMVLGIGFYRREQWPLLLSSALDSDSLEKRYDDWLDLLESSVEKIRSHGIEPELVEVDINDLLAFCRERGMQNNAAARAKFIAKLGGDRKDVGAA